MSTGVEITSSVVTRRQPSRYRLHRSAHRNTRVAMSPRALRPAWRNPPLPNHAARFGGGSLRRRVHEMTIGRHDKEDRVGPICEQGDGPEQPTPFEGAEKRDEPEDPADDGKARLHHVAALIGQLPLGKERAIVEL